MSGRARLLLAAAAAASLASSTLVTLPVATASAARVANPFAGAAGYVSPDWSARVAQTAAETGGDLGARMAQLATRPTAVWLDRIADLTAGRGLRGHLDAALAQQQATGRPVVLTLVLHNLPDRECDRNGGSRGELEISQNGLARYKTEFIDPAVAVLSDSRYAPLRVAAVLEPGSLVALARPFDRTARCALARSSGAYLDGIGYALGRLHQIGNVYPYLDAGNSGVVGWDTTVRPMLDLLVAAARRAPAGLSSVTGFVSNVAGYLPTAEPFITSDTVVGGLPVRFSLFYDFNPFVDETAYTQPLRPALVARGFPSQIGILLDTSRNGWGGPARPTAPSTSRDLNTFIRETAVDKRPRRDWWCNQAGAGLGAVPQAAPAPGVHAYAWIKPPGESDGWWNPAAPAGTPADRQCDPAGLWPLDQGSAWPTNALPGAPPYGQWFPAQFAELVRNAHPPAG